MSDPTDIRAWQRLSDRITTSGRLLPGDPARLAAMGIKRIVNLAMDDHPEALADEAEQCAAAGIAYTHIPVPFDAPDHSHFAAFRAAIEADDAPTHVHCIANYRVSAFFYRWHRDVAGMDEAQALAILERQWAPQKLDFPQWRAWNEFITPRDHGPGATGE